MGPSLREFVLALVEQFLRFDWRIQAAIVAALVIFLAAGVVDAF